MNVIMPSGILTGVELETESVLTAFRSLGSGVFDQQSASIDRG